MSFNKVAEKFNEKFKGAHPRIVAAGGAETVILCYTGVTDCIALTADLKNWEEREPMEEPILASGKKEIEDYELPKVLCKFASNVPIPLSFEIVNDNLMMIYSNELTDNPAKILELVKNRYLNM